MEILFHILGFCPDSISHPDLLDILSYYNSQTQTFIYNMLKIFNMYK